MPLWSTGIRCRGTGSGDFGLQAAAHTFDPHILVAVGGKGIVGSVVMNVTFPAFELTRSLYIRDLYVTKPMRRHGIGRALVKAAARLALSEGFSALEWTTDSENLAARAMYESSGARSSIQSTTACSTPH